MAIKKTVNKTHYSWVNRPKPYEGVKIKGESLTVQGEAFTVQELFARAISQGELPPNPSDQFYLDAPIEEINQLYTTGIDLTDLQDHADHIEKIAEAIQRAQLEQKSKESAKNSTSSDSTTSAEETAE